LDFATMPLKETPCAIGLRRAGTLKGLEQSLQRIETKDSKARELLNLQRG